MVAPTADDAAPLRDAGACVLPRADVTLGPAAAAKAAAPCGDLSQQQLQQQQQQAPGSFHGICLKGFHPKLIPAIPPPSAFEGSPDQPLVITRSPFASAQQVVVNGSSSPSGAVHCLNGAPLEYESAVGSGRIEVHVRGLRSTQPGVFDGKKRFVHVAVQAEFARPVRAGDLCIGQEMFSESVVPPWLSEALLTLAAKTFSSTTRVSVRSSPRYFMNPVLAACQLINISRKGEEPGMWDAPEDVRLLLPGCVDADGQPLPSEARRKWCDVPANIEGAEFTPGLVYTFHFWQHYADYANYKLSIGFLNIDLAPLLQRSPLQITCLDVGTGDYAFSLLAWNERCLYRQAGADEDGAPAPDAAASRAAAALRAAQGLRAAGAGLGAQGKEAAKEAGRRLASGVRGLLGRPRQ